MVKPHPGRFLVFTQIDWSKIDDPNFSREMVAQLDDAVRRGARGLKVLKDLGLEVRDKSGKLITVDDPHTTFVALHVANWPENLGYVSHLFDSFPNVMTEFGAREAELGRQPRRAREFFLKYQDRIMFVTDNGMEEEMYRNHFRWLETGDEYFDYWGYPAQGRWKIYGMELPDSVLEKVYHKNAERLFGQFKGPQSISSSSQ
jgi:Amidohydrolase